MDITVNLQLKLLFNGNCSAYMNNFQILVINITFENALENGNFLCYVVAIDYGIFVGTFGHITVCCWVRMRMI